MLSILLSHIVSYFINRSRVPAQTCMNCFHQNIQVNLLLFYPHYIRDEKTNISRICIYMEYKLVWITQKNSKALQKCSNFFSIYIHSSVFTFRDLLHLKTNKARYVLVIHQTVSFFISCTEFKVNLMILQYGHILTCFAILKRLETTHFDVLIRKIENLIVILTCKRSF